MDAWEEMALAFCEAVAPEARKIVRGTELRERGRVLRAEADAAAAAAESARLALVEAQEQENAARAAPKEKETRWFLTAALCFVLALGAFGAAAFLGNWLVLGSAGGVLLVAMLVCAGIGGAAQLARRAVIEAAEKARLAAELKFNELRLAHEALERAIGETRAAFDAIKLSVPVAAIGRLALPVRTATLAGYPAVLDEAGVFPDYQFELPNFTYDRSALDLLTERIEKLRNPPVLLEPGEGAHGDIDLLHGEEELLRRCVEDFAAFVGSIPTVLRRTPLVPRSSGAASAPGSAPVAGENAPLCTVIASTFQARLEEIAAISDHAQDLRARASFARAELMKSYDELRRLLGDYQTLRSTSIGDIHERLIASMERSTWCHIRFYCPKSMRVPRYLYETTGIDVDHVEDLTHEQLMDTLLRHDETAHRLSRDENLRKRIADSKSAVEELRYALSHALATMVPGEMSSPLGASQITVGASAAAVATHLQAQLRESIKHLRQVVLEAVTGASRPLLEIATQTRLRFDPVRGIWSSEVAGTEYGDQAHADYGRLLRLHEEVLFPIWNHLWTEKADFRRSELFRTNDQLLRMKEKESEKLIEIGNQFRADLRMVREQLKTLTNDLDAKVEQIRSTRDGLAMLGLLGEEDLERLSDAVLDDLRRGCDGALEHAAAKETLLALEPTAQADRRPGAADPIDIARSPDRLFGESLPEALVRQLAARASNLGHAPAAAAQTVGAASGLVLPSPAPQPAPGGDA
jgi:hypothetical protein